MSEKWISEIIKPDLKYSYKAEEVLFSGKSEFQKVEVFKTKSFGNVLFNDDLAMLSEFDEFIYHDMIAHPALFLHPNPKNVLVIGGGDGGTLREVLRHRGVDKCVMVEIDKMVVDASREFIPLTSSELDSPRAELIIDDGIKYVKETDQKFDVVLVDSTDPIGPATPLFGKEFYQDVFRVLTDDGISVSQGENSFFELEMQKSILKNLSSVFPKTYMYNYSNVLYPGGLWSFAMATKGLNPIKDFDSSLVENSELEFKYYNSGIHQACFQLASFQKKALGEYLSPIK
ncbi:MAG: polyamine aminopropyltransferase [Bdellovibrionales bacterium]